MSLPCRQLVEFGQAAPSGLQSLEDSAAPLSPYCRSLREPRPRTEPGLGVEDRGLGGLGS